MKQVPPHLLVRRCSGVGAVTGLKRARCGPVCFQGAFHPADIPIAVEFVAVLGKCSNHFKSSPLVQCCGGRVGRYVSGDDAMDIFSG